MITQTRFSILKSIRQPLRVPFSWHLQNSRRKLEGPLDLLLTIGSILPHCPRKASLAPSEDGFSPVAKAFHPISLPVRKHTLPCPKASGSALLFLAEADDCTGHPPGVTALLSRPVPTACPAVSHDRCPVPCPGHPSTPYSSPLNEEAGAVPCVCILVPSPVPLQQWPP